MIKHLKIKKRKCPVCGFGKSTKLYKENNWQKMDANGNIFIMDKRYCVCKRCDLVYTNPTVDSKVFDKLYSSSIVGSFFNYESTKNKKKISYFDTSMASLECST